jgi:hypothetical protein
MNYPNYKHVGGYINNDPYYDPRDEEEGDPSEWDDDDIPVNIFGETDEDR